jgi:hypothetical protein
LGGQQASKLNNRSLLIELGEIFILWLEENVKKMYFFVELAQKNQIVGLGGLLALGTNEIAK